MICLCLTNSTLKANAELVAKYLAYVDLMELRVDLLDRCDWEELATWCAEQKRDYGLPMIFTIRTQQDGGGWKFDEDRRLKLLSQALASNIFAFVDVEAQIYDLGKNALNISELLSLKGKDTTLILSQHSFQHGIDDGWSDSLIALAEQYPDCLIKSAVSCQGTRDLVRFFRQCSILRARIPNRYIVVPMGLFGIPGRILSCQTGSLISYCSQGGEEGLHHLGQIDPKTMVELYQYRALSPKSQIYGIIGNPVMHSLSPHTHNEFFKQSSPQSAHEDRANKVYIHIPVDDCACLKELGELINLRGLSVTIPHKTAILACLDTKDALVELCQSCNTVSINDGLWHGFNTDIGGFLLPLFKALNINTPRVGRLKGRAVTLIGAGGSAKALAFALLLEGADLLIVNRTLERAHELSDYLQRHNFANSKIEAAPLSAYEHIGCFSDLIIQTTSLGMEDNPLTPLPNYPFKGHEIVYDIVYKPPMTKLLKEAKRAGCRVISGQEMFIHQAILQSEIFRGASTV